MAPGIGGNGGGPRQTGTVPKTKSHNEASREYNGASRRDYHPFNHVHMPNNLSSLDWQPVNESLSHPRTRKESNTSASRFSESFDAEENSAVTQDNLWFNAGQRNQAYNSDDDEVSQASWAENGYKSNNLGQQQLGLPDKTQVASRLHQIRDYVNQTVSMMEGLRATGGQRNMAQHEKLSSMLEGLRDSELKLQNLYERLQHMPVAQSKGESENFPSHQMMDSPRDRTNKPVASSSKSTEAARKNELKKQVQISQLKLQELQEQQAALKALKQKAQEQLNEARAAQVSVAQGALMAAHGVSQAAANTDNMIQERLHNLQRFFDTRQQIVQIAGLEEEEEEVVVSEVKNKLEVLQAKKQHMDQLLAQFSSVANNVTGAPLHTVLYGQIVQIAGLEEEEVDVSEVENKLDELQAKKQHMDQLLAQFSNLHTSVAKNVSGVPLHTVLCGQIVQITGLEEEEVDASEVENKLDELQAKKQHMDQLLAQFSNLHTSVAKNVSGVPLHTVLCGQIVQITGLEEEEVDASEVENKLDELQAKKQHMDQLLAQFSNLHTSVANNVTDELSPEECERDVQNKMAELNAMKEFLSTLQNSATQLRPHSPQERVVKKDSRCGSVEKSNAVPTSQTLQAKTQQLNEAKAKLQQLQSLLQTVEELRSCGQPIPESVLRLMNGSDHSSSPTQQDRSEMSSQDLNMSQGPSERLVNACDRGDVFERSCRSLNSCERERVKQQPAANTAKHNNQEGKVGLKIQLEELIRNQDLNLPPPLQSSSFQENGTTIGTWGGSTQSTVDEGYNPDYSGDMTESASVKNVASTSQPHNMWRKPSTGSASRYSFSPYVPQEVRRGGGGGGERQDRPPSDIPPQPDSHWVVHQISQLQNQLQQMSGLYKNFVEKQQNCPPPWLTPPISAALGPYCQYIASAGQWQQQQLLVHSLNQCCQLIWHQQRELAALKETLSQIHHQAPEVAQFSPQQADAASTPPSNLGRAHNHSTLKPSLSSGPSLAPPAVVASAHSLPNLASPQSPPSPPPVNRNLLASPTATVLSLPPSLNNANPPNPNVFFNQSQFTDPNFINLYPPYGNNLNFEFPSPVNFFPTPPEPFLPFHPQPQPTTTLNNQVPPGNRANNYWDNFRSYSRQNLLSNSGKSNDSAGLPQTQTQTQRTPMERFLNTDPHPASHPPHPRSRKERLVGGEVNQLVTRAQVHLGEEGEGEASGYQYNLALPSHHGRQQAYLPHNNTFAESEGSCVRGNDCERPGLQGARLVNDCEAPRGANKKPYPEHCGLPSSGNKRNFGDIPAREAKLSLNNYHSEPSESNAEADASLRAINLPRRHPRNVNDNSNNLHHQQQQQQQQNCIGDGYCLMASDKGVRRKDNRGNVTKDCKADANGGGDSLEECVYSEVAALISVNEWRPQYLLQLFKDLRRLSSCPDPDMQATLSSTIHALAARTSQEEHQPAPSLPVGVNEESMCSQTMTAPEYLGNFGHQPQPRNWTQKEAADPPPPPPQLPPSCAKLDREVRSVLTELLPLVRARTAEACGPQLLESVRRLILQLVPTQTTLDQLDAQLEDALHKFHGCRLGDVYEELLTVVADVLISELTFLRLVNTVHHNHTEQQNGEVLAEGEEEDEEGAVGGAVGVGEVLSPSLLSLHPANQARRNKSEPVSEADLAEADQSRHSASGGEEERGDTAEGIDQSEEEASGQNHSVANCNGNIDTESKTEASWAVEQDRELGLDQVPTRLHNCEAEPPATPDPGSSI